MAKTVADQFAETVAAEIAKGFTLYMVKAVLNGRGDDLIDLARSILCSVVWIDRGRLLPPLPAPTLGYP
jgi:hypothetical protein